MIKEDTAYNARMDAMAARIEAAIENEPPWNSAMALAAVLDMTIYSMPKPMRDEVREAVMLLMRQIEEG
jgi:hypothetical protein